MPTNPMLEADYYRFLDENGLKPYDPQHSLDQFERLDKQRKTASGAEGIETDYPPEVLERFTEVINNKEMTFQRMLRHMAEETEEVIRTGLSMQPPQNVFAGEFPTGSFNALACPVENGTLILVNTGTMALISKMIRLMVINIFEHLIGDISPGDLFKDEKVDFRFKSGKSPLSVAEVVENIARCVFGYVASDDASILPKLHVLGGPQRISWSNLTIATERFIIAHEYGHAIAGHLDRSRTAVHAREIAGLKVYKKAWDDEFEADLIGARLVLHQARNPKLKEGTTLGTKESKELRDASESFAVSGALIFCKLDELVTEVERALYPEDAASAWGDHPPSQQRYERLLEFFTKESSTFAIKSAAELTNWLDNVRKWTTLLAEAVAGSEPNPENRLAAIAQLIPIFAAGVGARDENR